jgi:hypothetical protein
MPKSLWEETTLRYSSTSSKAMSQTKRAWLRGSVSLHAWLFRAANVQARIDAKIKNRVSIRAWETPGDAKAEIPVCDRGT